MTGASHSHSLTEPISRAFAKLVSWIPWVVNLSRNKPSKQREDPSPTSTYAAFISYRHVEPDRQWAAWLQDALETYDVPKAIAVEHGLVRRIGRVFQDDAELAASSDLSKEIRQALDRSAYMVVICSPRTPPSNWVNAEVEHFRRIGRGDRILALLIEGEPADAFPMSLRAIRSAITDRGDHPGAHIETVEPLAADVRPVPGESVRRRRQNALMRLVATIIGCRFDDLRQREHERQTRVLRNWAVAASALAAVLIGLSVYAEMNRRQAVRQRDHALEAQSHLLADLSKQQTAQGDARVGILLALEALPTNMSVPDRPYVAAAESALAQALVVPREIGVFRGHTGIVRHAAFSPDGSHVVTASYDRTGRIWSTATFQPSVVLRGHDDIVMHAAYRPDGKQVLTTSGDATARLWSTAGGVEVHVLRGHTDKVIHAVFSRNGVRVATASHDHTARIWDVTTGKELAVLRGHTDKVLSVQFSPDDSRVLTASEDRTARIWRATVGTSLVVLRGHGNKVNWAEFSPASTHIVTASDDGTARIWTADGRNSVVLQGHTQPVLHATFSPDATHVATASQDGTARLWRAADGAEIAVLKTGESIVNHVEFSPDGRRLVTGSGVLDLGNSTGRLWDAETGAEEAILHGHEGMLFDAAFSPDGKRVVTASYDNTARLWTTKGSLKIAGMAEDCQSEDVSSNLSANPTTATARPAGDRKPVDRQEKSHRLLEALHVVDAFQADDGRITKVIGMPMGKPPVLVNVEGHTTAELLGHTDTVHSAGFNSDGSRIVTASADHTARLWNGLDGAPGAVLTGHADTVWHGAFSPDGSRVATASQDHTARLWTMDGTPVMMLKGHDDGVIHVAFSTQGHLLVTASWDGTARIWNASTGAALRILRGHTDKVVHATFSPDDRRIATASLDGTARLWDVERGQEVAVLPAPDRLVLNVNFNEEGDRITLSSSSGSNCFRTFADTQALVEFARSLPLERLSSQERNRYRLEQSDRSGSTSSADHEP